MKELSFDEAWDILKLDNSTNSWVNDERCRMIFEWIELGIISKNTFKRILSRGWAVPVNYT